MSLPHIFATGRIRGSSIQVGYGEVKLKAESDRPPEGSGTEARVVGHVTLFAGELPAAVSSSPSTGVYTLNLAGVTSRQGCSVELSATIGTALDGGLDAARLNMRLGDGGGTLSTHPPGSRRSRHRRCRGWWPGHSGGPFRRLSRPVAVRCHRGATFGWSCALLLSPFRRGGGIER